MNSLLGTRSDGMQGESVCPYSLHCGKCENIVLYSFWCECAFVLFLFLATTSKISRVSERMAAVSRNQSRQNPWTSGLDWEVSSGRLIHPWRPKPGTATKPSSRRRPWQDSRRCPSYTVFSIPLSHFVVCLLFFTVCALFCLCFFINLAAELWFIFHKGAPCLSCSSRPGCLFFCVGVFICTKPVCWMLICCFATRDVAVEPLHQIVAHVFLNGVTDWWIYKVAPRLARSSPTPSRGDGSSTGIEKNCCMFFYCLIEGGVILRDWEKLFI